MTFYLGREYHLYAEKFEKLKNYITKHYAEIRNGSNAEIFRWMIDRLYPLMQEVLEEPVKPKLEDEINTYFEEKK